MHSAVENILLTVPLFHRLYVWLYQVHFRSCWVNQGLRLYYHAFSSVILTLILTLVLVAFTHCNPRCSNYFGHDDPVSAGRWSPQAAYSLRLYLQTVLYSHCSNCLLSYFDEMLNLLWVCIHSHYLLEWPEVLWGRFAWVFHLFRTSLLVAYHWAEKDCEELWSYQ